MSKDDAAIEKEIQAKGLNAPRLNPEYINGQIVAEYSVRGSAAFTNVPMTVEMARSLSCLTLAVVVTKNGFVLTGESACASPENYDPEIGHKIAVGNAKAKLWQLEGYVLRNKLAGLG
jgi:hypothetical protein